VQPSSKRPRNNDGSSDEDDDEDEDAALFEKVESKTRDPSNMGKVTSQEEPNPDSEVNKVAAKDEENESVPAVNEEDDIR